MAAAKNDGEKKKVARPVIKNFLVTKRKAEKTGRRPAAGIRSARSKVSPALF